MVRNPKQGGFTLIELMIVVAIVAILAAIALPQIYQNYVARSQVSEAIALMDGLMTPVGECIHESGDVTGCSTGGTSVYAKVLPAAATDTKGNYTKQVAVADGVMTATLTTGAKENSKVSGATLSLTPTVNGGSVSWACTTSLSATPELVPAACR